MSRLITRCRRRDSNPRHADYDWRLGGRVTRGYGGEVGFGVPNSGRICRFGDTFRDTVSTAGAAPGTPFRNAYSSAMRRMVVSVRACRVGTAERFVGVDPALRLAGTHLAAALLRRLEHRE